MVRARALPVLSATKRRVRSRSRPDASMIASSRVTSQSVVFLSPRALRLIGLAGTMLKWMPLSPIRSAFRHSGPLRWNLSSMHSRGLLIRARSGRCDLIFLFTFSPAAAIQLAAACCAVFTLSLPFSMVSSSPSVGGCGMAVQRKRRGGWCTAMGLEHAARSASLLRNAVEIPRALPSLRAARK